jgi:thiamine-phosphate pyrophosphorylase
LKLLYVTDRAAAGTGRLQTLLRALAGSPSLSVQLREKEMPDREVLAWARSCREWLGPAVTLYVNRRFDIALASGADGVHLPADGLPVSRARANTPRHFRIGISTHSPDEAREAITAGADLVLIGPIFESPSKAAFGPPLGPEALAQLPYVSEHRAEVLAIGGIDEESLDRLEPYRDRVSGIAGIRLFQSAADPRALAERISRR